MDRHTVLQHIRFASGFRLIQRRGKNGTCNSYPSYANFADDCYADTFADGRIGLAYDQVRMRTLNLLGPNNHQTSANAIVSLFVRSDRHTHRVA